MTKPIEIGRLARKDPLLAFATVMASDLTRQAASRPRATRLEWLRGELNKAQPGLGDRFMTKARTLRRRGRASDQAAFDALRLVLANRFATHLDAMVPTHSAAGLGDSRRDIDAVFCGLTMAGTVGGSIASSFESPAGSAAIGQAGAAALQAAGCNSQALEQQARIAEANRDAALAAQMAAANREAGSAAADDNTLTLVAIGGGVLLLGIAGIALMR